MPTHFPVDVTTDRLIEFLGTIRAICVQEIGRDPYLAPSPTHEDSVGAIMLLFAMEGWTGEQLTDWLHDSAEAIAYRTHPPEPAHVDPGIYSDAQLLAIRGALNIRLPGAPMGPRPGAPTAMASTNGLWHYSPEWQAKILSAYRDERHYTHGPIGPFVDPGYHGQFPPVDIRNDAEREQVEAALQTMWDSGVIPVVFIQNDGWPITAMERDMAPIFRSEKWQKLCRVVCNGFEQQGSVYGWSNQEYVDWLTWLKSVFPNAKRLLHTVAGIEAPVGAGDDTSQPGMSNGECWGRVTPLIHGWLRQGNELFDPGPDHVDPAGDGRTDEQHWYDLADTSVASSMVNRFRQGYAGWPTTSANGGPMKWYHGEYYSFYLFNTVSADEAYAQAHGKRAVELGADGAFDGWAP
jgi:hypothetical protein